MFAKYIVIKETYFYSMICGNNYVLVQQRCESHFVLGPFLYLEIKKIKIFILLVLTNHENSVVVVQISLFHMIQRV